MSHEIHFRLPGSASPPTLSAQSAVRPRTVSALSIGAFCLALGGNAWAIVDDRELGTVAELETSPAEHCDEIVASGVFEDIFVCGDEFFEVDFLATDGGGANVGQGQRYTRTPRADLNGPGEWANHFPQRPTGPNSASCAECHSFPVGTAAGRAGFNVTRDPFHTADPGRMINRNTPHLMGSGALQLLAEEMTDELAARVAEAEAEACQTRREVRRELTAKGVRFGEVRVQSEARGDGCRTRVEVKPDGIDRDLIVRPFQWKGSDLSLRDFVRTAFNNEIGMQPVETTGDDVDGDGDGVANEVSVADVTATTVYVAGQPRPVTEIELDQLRADLIAATGADGEAFADELGLPQLTQAEIDAINAGEWRFDAIGCTGCHKPSLPLGNPVFSEPSQHPAYRDTVFPAGQDPIARGVDPAYPVSFDLTADMPDNHVVLGSFFRNMANFTLDENGNTVVALYGDLKRHRMGRDLEEQIDEQGTGADSFMTKELWGVGSTPPYLHDGRATTLTEAILLHGGDARAARDAFTRLPSDEQAEIVRFLKNLVIFKMTEG
jgi:hypothetical protein